MGASSSGKTHLISGFTQVRFLPRLPTPEERTVMRYGPIDLIWWLGEWIGHLSWGLWIGIGLMLLALPTGVAVLWDELRKPKQRRLAREAEDRALSAAYDKVYERRGFMPFVHMPTRHPQ